MELSGIKFDESVDEGKETVTLTTEDKTLHKKFVKEAGVSEENFGKVQAATIAYRDACGADATDRAIAIMKKKKGVKVVNVVYPNDADGKGVREVKVHREKTFPGTEAIPATTKPVVSMTTKSATASLPKSRRDKLSDLIKKSL